MDSRTLFKTQSFKTNIFSLLPFLLVSPLVLADALTDSQETVLDTVMVTSDFRPVTLEDSTVSVSVVSKEEIKKRGAQHIEDVLNAAPNVNMSSGASRAHYFQIRGIGERSQFKAPINPSVGLYVDGMDFSRSGAAATLFDVEQVEVIRGPQGTKYGASALAGIINLKTTEPTNETKLHVEATVAGFDTRSLGVAAGGALVKDKLLGRFSLHKNTSDGYITNAHLNRDDTNNRDETTARAHLKWLANEDLTVDMRYLHLDIDNGYDAFNFNNTFTTFSDQPGKDTQKTNAFSIESIWDINAAVTMETNTSYSDSDLEYSYDEDWTFVGQSYDSFDQYLRNRNNKSVDIRFVSNDEGRIFNDKTGWVAGFYSSNKSESLTRKYTFDSDFTSQYDTKNRAIYGQLDTEFTDRLTLTTGLRTEQWDVDYSDSDNKNYDIDELLYGGKLGVEYELTDDHLTHASISRGYKAGGVNTDGSLSQNLLNFDTEYLWNFEVGINSSWMNDALSTRVSAFFSQRRNQQVNSSFLTTESNGRTKFNEFTVNAQKGRNYGLEAELDWKVNNKLGINASLGLLEARFDKFDDPQSTGNSIIISGRDQAHAPNYQYSLGAEYKVTPKLTAGMNLEGKDSFFFSDRHDEKAASYGIVNANLAYKKDNWTATLWGRNLLDKDYDVRGFGSFNNNPLTNFDQTLPERYTQKGEPRVVGVTLSYDF